MDVVGLYNNIPHADGLTACRTMLDRRQLQDPPTDAVISLAKLVLELNAFQYDGSFYLQTHGTAMGTRMAPSYANLFMGDLEEKMLSTAPGKKIPPFYRRFIDDIFGIWFLWEEALKQFFTHVNTCDPDIRFTYTYGHSVDFYSWTRKSARIYTPSRQPHISMSSLRAITHPMFTSTSHSAWDSVCLRLSVNPRPLRNVSKN